MGLKLGKLLKNAGSLGTTWMRDQRQAKKKKKKAAELQAQMAAEAEEFQNRDLGQTAFTGVQADPAMVAAQQRALQQTQAVAAQGYTDVDKAAMQQQLRDAARYEQGQRQSLGEDANARGMGGSGFAMQSQLAAQQAGADRATETATNMAIEGRDRSQAATQQVAQMAGGMRDQGFGEQATRAGATDQYGQWRANTQGNDFANLQAARAGTVGQMQAAAAEQESTPNLDYGVQALATYYSGGLAGGGGGQPTNAVGTPGSATAKNMPGAQPSPQPGAAPAPTPAAPPGGAQQKMQPPVTPQTPPAPAPIAGPQPTPGPQTKAMPGAMPGAPRTMAPRPGGMNLGNAVANAVRPGAATPGARPGMPAAPGPTRQSAPSGGGMNLGNMVANAVRPGAAPAGPPMKRRPPGASGAASRIMSSRMAGGPPRG